MNKSQKRLKAAESALEAIMADERLSGRDSWFGAIPRKIARKIDNWKAIQLAELQNPKPERK